MSGLRSLFESYTSASPIFPNNAGATVTVPASSKVGKVLDVMINSKLSAVPVVDDASGKPLFFLTLMDIIAYAMRVLSEEDVRVSFLKRLTSWIHDDTAEVENATAAAVFDAVAAGPKPPVCVLIQEEQSVAAAARMMLKNHANRALVIDPAAPEKVRTVLSMSRLLQLSAPFVSELDIHDVPIGKLGLGNPYCIVCHEDDDVYHAFRRMVAHYVPSMAVVDHDGRLVGNLSASDFKLMHFESHYWSLLGKTVRAYLAEVHKHAFVTHDDRAATWDADAGRVLQSFTPQSTFADVAAAMHRYRVHHIYVVDAQRRPIGVVSNRDVIREILHHI